MKRRTILLILTLVVTFTGSTAQDKGPQRFSPEEFRARLEEHITKEAKLTKAEADKFFPIYREMKDKQRKVAMQAQELKRKHPASDATDKDYLNVVTKIAALDAQVASIESEYYKKLCKVVSPKKVYAAILADDDFSRRMVQHFRGGGKPGEKGGGKPGEKGGKPGDKPAPQKPKN